jgi:hypothetical protein
MIHNEEIVFADIRGIYRGGLIDEEKELATSKNVILGLPGNSHLHLK